MLEIDDDKPLVFLDNDNVYPASLAESANPDTAFLGFDWDSSGSTAFSFIKASPTGMATEIAEKQRISDQYGTGVYGFASKAQFIEWARYTMQHGPFVRGEMYMSSVYVNMIAAGVPVKTRHVPIVPIGTTDLAETFMRSLASKVHLRICFDLDNTLVTYPNVPGDYSTVQPVPNMVALAQWARNNGHTVIVYTARRMLTHKHNVGRVTADIARVTFDTLDKFNIPYDEIIFGKPIADVYIDDRAINPYLMPPRAMGLPFGPALPAVDTWANKLPNNRLNAMELQRASGTVKKTGPSNSMAGEAFFYKRVQSLPGIRGFFPQLMGEPVSSGAPDGEAFSPGGATSDVDWHAPATGTTTLSLEFITGVPLTTLFSYRVLEPYHLDLIFDALRCMHNCEGVDMHPRVQASALGRHYVDKLRDRFASAEVYPFDNKDAVLSDISVRMARYEKGGINMVPVVHGDCWLANIILTSTNQLKFVDMRGHVGTLLTTNGDAGYDYGKLCQSLLGFDEAVFSLRRVPHAYRMGLLRAFAECLRKARVSPASVLDVAICLIAGTLPFSAAAVRTDLWELVVQLLHPTTADYEEVVSAMCD